MAQEPSGEAGERVEGSRAWVQSEVSQIVDKLRRGNRQLPSQRTFHPANLLLTHSQVAVPAPTSGCHLSWGDCHLPLSRVPTPTGPGESLRMKAPGGSSCLISLIRGLPLPTQVHGGLDGLGLCSRQDGAKRDRWAVSSDVWHLPSSKPSPALPPAAHPRRPPTFFLSKGRARPKAKYSHPSSGTLTQIGLSSDSKSPCTRSYGQKWPLGPPSHRACAKGGPMCQGNPGIIGSPREGRREAC